MVRVAIIASLAAVLAALPWAAVAQQCLPTDALNDAFEVNGWRVHDNMSAPAGFVYRIVCMGPDGGLVLDRPDGLTCFLSDGPIPGLCGLPQEPPENES